MKKTWSSVSEPGGIWKYRGFALIMFAVLMASALGVLVSSFYAFGGQTETSNGLPEMEAMGDDWPEPTGAPGSGWIADQLAEGTSNDVRSPAIATGPGGELHVAYEVWTVAAGYQIAYGYSLDGGLNWITGVLAGASPEDDFNPDIAVSPFDGRIFVVYERHIIPGIDVDIYVAYSDDYGLSWTRVWLGIAGVTAYTNPSIVVEHNQGATYNVYVAFEENFGDPDNRNVFLYRSTDQGVTYTSQLYLGAPPDPSVYADPDLAYQRGPDMIDRLFMVYAYGNDAVDTQNIGLLWSEDRAGTFMSTTVRMDTDLVFYPTIAASRDGDTVLTAWQVNRGGDYLIRWAYLLDTTSPTDVWFWGNRDSLAASDYAPRLSVDGEGTASDTIGGNYHLIWTVGTAFDYVNYTSIATVLDTAVWTATDTIDDLVGGPSVGFPAKGLTTQNRGGTWYPAAVWGDSRAGIADDIYYSTPGMRATVDTNPASLDIEVAGIPMTAPQSFDWPAGNQYDIFAPSPQIIGPNSQYSWVSWSDAGAQMHPVTATTTDTIYTAWFVVQHNLTIDAFDTTNGVPLANVPIYVDGPPIDVTPYTSWFDEGTTYNIGVEDPYNDGTSDYNFVDWDFGSTFNPDPYTVSGPATLIARYQEVVPAPYFELSISPQTQTISPGDDAIYTVTVKSWNSYAGSVDLTAAAAPPGLLPGATESFLPNPVVLLAGETKTSTLTITNTGGVPDNTYAINVNGQDTVMPLTHDNTTELVVDSNPFFTVDATPALRQIASGDSTSYTFSITSNNAYVGTVDVSVSHTLTTADATLSWSSPTVDVPADGTNSTTLTVNTNPSIAAADYVLTFYGEDLLLPLNLSDDSTLNVSADLPGTITGIVYDSNDNLIEDADVELLDGANLVDTTISASDGEYTFTNVDPGSYTVRATKTGYRDDEISVTLSSGEDLGGKDLVLGLGTIRGRVIDEDGGVNDATVKVYDENDDLVVEGTTSSNGDFRFDDLLLGTYKVVISADGYETFTEEGVEIPESGTNNLGNMEIVAEAGAGDFLSDYWWLLLLIIIIVVVLILVVLLAKRKKPQPEAAPPQYAMAQVPEEQAPPYQAPPEQQPYQPPPEAPPETYPEEPYQHPPPEETPPERPPDESY
jgi:hypothetical protein